MAAISSNKKIGVTHLNIRQSIFILLFKLVLLDLLVAFLAVAFLSLLSTSIFSPGIKIYLLAFHVIYFVLLVALKVALTFYVVLAWLNEYYEIWPEAIVHKGGIIWRKEVRYPFRQIRFIKMYQGMIGKLCNYGSLEIFDWRLTKYTTMYLIHNPHRYERILESLVPKAGQEKEIVREHLIRGEEE